MGKSVQLNDYNYYDRGYSTGAQTSLFIGPIWVEEILSINVATGSNDVPVYPYASPYYNRLLLGRYLVTGTFAIPYIKPSYLLEIINKATSSKLSSDEVQSMIESRSSVFAQTVAAKISKEENNPAKISSKDIAAYVKRVCREIELSTTGFDLTIIQGNLYGETSSIEIYNNVKIVSVQKGLLNDDETVVELYTFTAQRMPEKPKKKNLSISPSGKYVTKEDTINMIKEIANDLIKEALVYPEFNVFSPTHRSSKIYNTDKMGITGPLNESTRNYGKQASFCELVYGYKFPKTFDLLNPKTDIADDDELTTNKKPISDRRKARYKLPVRTAGSTSVEYINPQVSSIPNSNGEIVSLDRELSSKYICAVAPVEPIATSIAVKGGTVLMPRSKNIQIDVGSFVPPKVVPCENYSYTEDKLDGLKYGVMWNTLIGCRSSGTKDSTSTDSSEKTITEIGRPLLSISYHANTQVTKPSDKEWKYSIGSPVYLDFIDTNKTSTGGKSKEPLLDEGWDNKNYEFTGNPEEKSVKVKAPVADSETPIESEVIVGGNISNNNKDGATLSVFYDKILLGEDLNTLMSTKPEPGLINLNDDYIYKYLAKFHYKFFKITVPLVSRCAIDFNKSLNIQPFVFLREGADTTKIPDDAIFDTIDPHSTDVNKVMKAVADKMSAKGEDDSCKVDFTFDWVVTSINSDIENQSVTICGVYYAHKKSGTTYSPNATIDVCFVASVIPINDYNSKSSDKSNKPAILDDLKSHGGQYSELYAFIRCDTTFYYSVPIYEPASQIDVFDGTPLIHTAVWSHMNDLFLSPASANSEIEYQFGVYKELLTKFIVSNGSVLPDLLGRPFDIDKDVVCLQFPVKASLTPISGFVKGYGFRLNPKRLLEIISNISFSSGVDLTNVAGFRKATGEELELNSIGNLINNLGIGTEALTEISKSILDQIEIAGYKISTEDFTSGDKDPSTIYVETDLVTPAPKVVSYGMSDEGYKELKGETVAAESDPDKTLKGYIN